MIKVKEAEVTNLVRTRIPTEHGEFILYYYRNTIDNKEHIALVKGNIVGMAKIPVRIHSECFTGDVLGSRRCDCGEQLHLSLSLIGNFECGILIYLRQEGRGIGLLEKLKAYNLQDQGLDTVDANIHLGHLPDERNYQLAALILKDLEVDSVRVMTNNPKKIAELSRHSIQVVERIPIEVQHHNDNADYLKTKAKKMAHLLSLDKTKRRMDKMSFLQPLVNQLVNYRQPAPKKPFVTVSYAQSIDGSIAFRNSDSISLSCQKSLEMTHLLRSCHDALLVGINTILVDDPQLNVRYSEGNDPQPVILDSQLRFPLTAKLLVSPLKRPIILTTDQAPEEKKDLLENKGARVLSLKANSSNHVDLPSALELLSELELKTVMVEGGASVIGDFLGSQLVNYCIVTVAPRFIGGLKAVENLNRPHNLPSLTIVNCQYHRLDSDIIIYGPVGPA